MSSSKLFGIIIIAFVGILLAPWVIDILIIGVTTIFMGIIYLWNKLTYTGKIKKGLKNGTIVEIDGKYYTVEIVKEN